MNDDQRQNGSSGDPDAASWFVRLQRHPDDRDVQEAFKAWLAADPAHQDAWAQVDGAWDRLGELKEDPEILAARQALKAELEAGRPRPRMAWAAGFAVAVMGGALLAYGGWRQARPLEASVMAAAGPEALAVYRTPVGGRRTVTLEDGSKVTLNTDTEVRLAGWEDGRRLTLVRGEAYFEVAKDPRRPFVVSAAGRTVTALGTAFDVRLDPHRWSVSLVEGKVRVAAADESVDMAPGDHLVQADGEPWSVEKRNLDELTSWRDGSLVFENRPLGAIVAEMNRYSTRQVRITDPALASPPLSGRFKSGDVAGFVATLEAYGVVRADRSSAATIDLHPVVSE